jgi:hypothetical protein
VGSSVLPRQAAMVNTIISAKRALQNLLFITGHPFLIYFYFSCKEVISVAPDGPLV